MPGARPGHRLLGVWLPKDFHRAVGLLAAARGETQSEMLRRLLVREATGQERESTDEQRAETANC